MAPGSNQTCRPVSSANSRIRSAEPGNAPQKAFSSPEWARWFPRARPRLYSPATESIAQDRHPSLIDLMHNTFQAQLNSLARSTGMLIGHFMILFFCRFGSVVPR